MTSFQIEDIETNAISNAHTPLESFMYALRAKETIRQYPKRLKVFLDFLTSKNELSHSDLENQYIENSILKSEYL